MLILFHDWQPRTRLALLQIMSTLFRARALLAILASLVPPTSMVLFSLFCEQLFAFSSYHALLHCRMHERSVYEKWHVRGPGQCFPLSMLAGLERLHLHDRHKRMQYALCSGSSWKPRGFSGLVSAMEPAWILQTAAFSVWY